MTVIELLHKLLEEVASGNGDNKVCIRVDQGRNSFAASKKIVIWQSFANAIVINAEDEE